MNLNVQRSKPAPFTGAWFLKDKGAHCAITPYWEVFYVERATEPIWERFNSVCDEDCWLEEQSAPAQEERYVGVEECDEHRPQVKVRCVNDSRQHRSGRIM